jgi:hypothetical protein
MQRADFVRAFRVLGDRLNEPAEIIVAGGSALLLLGIVDRETGDIDAVACQPKLSTIARDIALVGEDLGLPVSWLNDGVRAYHDLLAADYRDRLTTIGEFGALTVRALGRPDLILLKIAAARPRDLDDLRALAPTVEEIAFVASQLDRINRVRPRDALRMRLYLDQGGDHGHE